MPKRLALVLVCLFAFALPAKSQGIRVDDIAIRGTNPLQLIPSPVITVCTSTGTGAPCTPLATTYTDATLTTPCGAATQVVLSNTSTCVATGDTSGNFGFWVAPGTYIVTITSVGNPAFTKKLTLACQIASNCTLTGSLTVTGALNASGGGALNGSFSGPTTLTGPLLLAASPCGASPVSIQSLINALPTANSGGDAGGGSIYLPCGTYTINAGLTVQNHGAHIRGDGFGTVILAGASMTGTDMLKVFAGGSYVFVRDFSLEDLVMDCNGVAGVRGLHIQDLQDRGLIRNVTFRNCDGNEIFFDVLNTVINSHITIDNVITYPFRVKGTPVSWNIQNTEYLEIKHSKVYGNNGSGGRNTGPGINLQGVNRSYIDSATAVSLWTTGYQVTSGLNGSDSVSFDNPSCESVLTTCVNLTGAGGGTATTRWKIYSINVPSPAPTTLLNCDFCTHGMFFGRTDAAITFTANSTLNTALIANTGSLPTDSGTNNLLLTNLAGSFFTGLNKPLLSGLNLQLAGATDNGLSRVAAATLGVGNGTQADVSGTLQAATLAISGTLKNIANTATMGLTLKKGSGAGNYTSASTTYVVVDSTNLCNTVTIPTGWSLSVAVAAYIGTATAVADSQLALTDNASCATANAGILQESPPIDTTAAGKMLAAPLGWKITGDGASHSIALQFKTANAADSVILANSSGTLLPTMVFQLEPSN